MGTLMESRTRVVVWLVCLTVLATFAFQPARAAEPSARFRVFLPGVIHASSSIVSPEAQAMLDEINQARALQTTIDGQPCPPLAVSPALTEAAVDHSVDMALRHFFSHINPDGATPLMRAQEAGYTGSRVGENIVAGYPTSHAAVNAWMHSPAHRANMLNCAYTDTGIGYYDLSNDPEQYSYYWTEVFGAP